MNVFVCIDENNGMMFNNRRQSQDSEVRARILDISSNKKLFMNAYSAKQFEDNQEIIIDEDFISKANLDDYCFIENIAIPEEDINKLYVFNWNRRYPSDFKFNFDFVGNGLKKISTEEFTGSSHEKITLDIYGRNV